jgi:uncharacterized protein RhaS with RHS repeats
LPRGARYYDPSLGRFTQPDTISHLGDLQQGNAYTYAGGDPVDNVDPSGKGILSGLSDALAGGFDFLTAQTLYNDFLYGTTQDVGADLAGYAIGGLTTLACETGISLLSGGAATVPAIPACALAGSGVGQVVQTKLKEGQ